ncbi:MAG: DUF1700 domain-containing protein [Candidatus Izimaplasma sp.]|nr:DUF1700 domain-containing protein [Candidatus Izimaplasma bacterium]
MKNDYLKELRDLLDNYKMEQTERDEIISDYDEMYEGYNGRGMVDDDIVKKLGSPRSIIRDLTEGFRKVEKPLPGGEKVIALTPFISLIAFFILGFGFDLWHPGWLVFLIIPVTAIVVEMGKTRDEHLTTALSPFFASLLFLYLGFYHNLWHPGWIVFIIIPMLGVWNSRRTLTLLDLIVSLSPFIAVIAYVYLGLKGYWIEGWVVFLIIPMLGLFNEKVVWKFLLWELLFIGGIAGYLYVGYIYPDMWAYGLFAFIPVLVLGVITGNVQIGFGDVPKNYKIVILVSTAVFLLIGFIFNGWGIAWLAFLAIPVYAINTEAPKKDRMVASTPFVALVIFFILGFFFDLWAYSWMAFLIIPMVAIIKNN